jgi:hypothetical protein
MDSGGGSPPLWSFSTTGNGGETHNANAKEASEYGTLSEGLFVDSDKRKMSGVDNGYNNDFQSFAPTHEQQGKRVTRRRCSSVSRMSIGDTSGRELKGMLWKISVAAKECHPLLCILSCMLSGC